MADRDELLKTIQDKEAQLRELRDARPKASCAQKNYSRPEDMTRAMRVEQLEEDLADLKTQLEAAG